MLFIVSENQEGLIFRKKNLRQRPLSKRREIQAIFIIYFVTPLSLNFVFAPSSVYCIVNVKLP